MADAPVLPYTLIPLGDRALIIELGADSSEITASRVRAVADELLHNRLPGVIDVVPAVCTVAVHYDPMRVELAAPRDTPYAAIALAVATRIQNVQAGQFNPQAPIDIPVCYGGPFGEDIESVARLHGLTVEHLVELHAGAVYRVQMLGFAPGFAYLAGLDTRLITPRRTTPRTRVPAGSVAIGGELTGIYPFELPGGWHLIGRSPVRMFDVKAQPPSRLALGDRVRFVPITEPQYEQLREPS
jgi:inhibitor of KinA